MAPLPEPTFPPRPSFDLNLGARTVASDTPLDPAGSRPFKKEEPEHQQMIGLFLISEHENVAFELTDDMFEHRQHADLCTANV
jgi:hypothetical protein